MNKKEWQKHYDASDEWMAFICHVREMFCGASVIAMYDEDGLKIN